MNLNTEPEGLRIYPGHFDGDAQRELLAAIRAVLAVAPLFTPRMPKSGRPFSVRMSNCGSLGWISDEHGYRYEPIHPATGRPWPPIPETLIALWRNVARYADPPEACAALDAEILQPDMPNVCAKINGIDPPWVELR